MKEQAADHLQMMRLPRWLMACLPSSSSIHSCVCSSCNALVSAKRQACSVTARMLSCDKCGAIPFPAPTG